MRDKLSIDYSRESDEVLYIRGQLAMLSSQDIDGLVALAKQSPRKRIRICAHSNRNCYLHDMIIVHFQDTYVRPHKHTQREESIHVIRGCFDLVLFDDYGNIKSSTRMGEHPTGRNFFFRVRVGCYHTLVPRSETIVFHEATQGPFKKSETVFAGWSPEEGDDEKIFKYRACLDASIDQYSDNPTI